MATARLSWVLCSLFVLAAHGLCPNQCSGHGSCGAWDRCTCYANWQEGDCSLRTCPYKKAFADTKDTSTTGREPHYYAECSGKGICDRATGQCTCFQGYEGKGCDRLACPGGSDCSGHGECKLMSQQNSGYSDWDASKIQVCVCDPAWTGPDCNQRMCKYGDDPMSVFDANGAQTQTNEVQFVKIKSTAAITAAGAFTLKYTDWAGETWTTWPIFYDTLSAIDVEEALEGLPDRVIPTVTVTMYSGIPDAATAGKGFYVTFSSADTPGNQPVLQIDGTACTAHGCQPYLVGLATGGTLTLEVAETDGTEERQECAGRGKCNTETGLCECFDGFYGESCSMQTVIL